jgi:hypothetical protein
MTKEGPLAAAKWTTRRTLVYPKMLAAREDLTYEAHKTDSRQSPEKPQSSAQRLIVEKWFGLRHDKAMEGITDRGRT